MSLGTYVKGIGSEKAQSSQTIRMLMLSLQYLAEDSANSNDTSANYTKIVSGIINSTVDFSTKYNINEQASTLLLQMGWKNTQIRLKSADVVEMIFGSNRYLDQTEENKAGLVLIVKSICIALGEHILQRSCDALVNYSSSDKTYRIDIQATSALELDKSDDIKTSAESVGMKTHNRAVQPTERVISNVIATQFDTSQIILPILNNRLPMLKLQQLLKDVSEEFCKSWFGGLPELNAKTDGDNLTILIGYMIQKATENGNDIIEVGKQIGNYFADAIIATFPSENAVSSEILDGSSVGSIIRDIKARSLCSLTETQNCGTQIGGKSRKFCDLSMGIWSGTLGKLTDKTYTFSGFYGAGKRDPFCLMEFTVS